MKKTKNGRTKLALLAALAFSIAGCQQSKQQSEYLQNDTCYTPQIMQKTTINAPLGNVIATEDISSFIAQKMSAKKIPGASIAIINDGEIVFHQVAGVTNAEDNTPVTPCTLFQGASITKPLFGHFVMTFVEEGLLDLDRPLYEYLPYSPIAHDKRYQKITARMALTHQTGFPNWRTDFPDNQLFIQFEPGTNYHYSGEGYKYLTLALQAITGLDAAGLEARFQEKIAKPIGLRHTQIVPDDTVISLTASPHNKGKLVEVKTENSFKDFGAAYGVHSEAVDFSHWLIALMNEETLVTATLNEYFRPQQVPIPDNEPLRQIGLVDYALGFAIYDFPFGRHYAHGGNNPGYTSVIAMDKKNKWGLVVFTNANQVTDFALELLFYLNTNTGEQPQ
jgi:CubicO group peptidase (beta-lactamase class C family)